MMKTAKMGWAETIIRGAALFPFALLYMLMSLVAALADATATWLDKVGDAVLDKSCRTQSKLNGIRHWWIHRKDAK